MSILFIHDHRYEDMWRDGLWAALQVLKGEFDLNIVNIRHGNPALEAYEFVLGWGAFGSQVDRLLSESPVKKGLCIAGNAVGPDSMYKYDVLFYETDWYKPDIQTHPLRIKAFGTNTDIYKPMEFPKVFDVLSVGAFALWKRFHRVEVLQGVRMIVGEVQQENLSESLGIIQTLACKGVGVMGMVSPDTLSKLYNMSKLVYIPSTVFGGGERAVLEARACGIPVQVEPDNPKLKELVDGKVYDHIHYANQLKKGIKEALR